MKTYLATYRFCDNALKTKRLLRNILLDMGTKHLYLSMTQSS